MSFIPLSALVLMLALPMAPAAAESGGLEIELNKLEPVAEGCRAYLVFSNHTPSAFTELKLDLVMFDTGGVIAKRMALNAAPLPADKTTVKLFDVADLACEDLGRVLLNEVIACGDDGGPRSDCAALVAPSSRAAAAFVK